MDSNKLRPPPVSAQGRSVMNARVEGFRLIVVPPAATTLGETPGHSVPGESPVEAKNTTPDLINFESKLVSPENSPPPQLLETSPPPAVATRLAATVSAASRFERLFDAASTRMILALGAIACAHSMSRDASSSHPPVGSCGGLIPLAKTLLKFAVGRPNWAEKVARSVAAFGSSKASTMAITLLPPDGLRVAVVGLQPETRVETKK